MQAIHVPPAHALFDHLIASHHLKNDSALSLLLDVAPSQISKVRSGKMAVSAGIILKTHERTGMTVADIRRLIPA